MSISNLNIFTRRHNRNNPKVKKGKSFRKRIQNGILNENKRISCEIDKAISLLSNSNLRVYNISKMLNVDHKSIIQFLNIDNNRLSMHSLVTEENLLKLKTAFENDQIELIKYDIKVSSFKKVKRPFVILINTPM